MTGRTGASGAEANPLLSLSWSSDHRDITVYLGRHSQSGSNPKEESRRVQRSECHPQFDFLTNDNDICLLQLAAPVTFSDAIYPVCLAAANSTFHSGTSSWVTGWGLTDNGKGAPSRALGDGVLAR